MTKFEFVAGFLTAMGLLVEAMLYSDRFAGRMESNKRLYTAIATTLTVLVALSVAAYVDFIHYGEFVLWRFSLTTFSVFSISIGISIIWAIFKIYRDDRKELRKHKKLARETEKFIRDTKASMRRDMITDHNAYSRADECTDIKGGYVKSVVSFEEKRKEKKINKSKMKS